VSLLGGSLVAVSMIAAAVAGSGAQRTGLLLVASMLVLALLEHLLMVTPMSPVALWRWALRQGEPSPSAP
jgi:hypothetical protein